MSNLTNIFNVMRELPNEVLLGLAATSIVGTVNLSATGVKYVFDKFNIAWGRDASDIEIYNLAFFPTGKFVPGTELEEYDAVIFSRGDYTYKEIYTGEKGAKVLADYMRKAQKLAIDDLGEEGWKLVPDYIHQAVDSSFISAFGDSKRKTLHRLRAPFRNKFSRLLSQGSSLTDAEYGFRERPEMVDVYPITIARRDSYGDVEVQTYLIPRNRAEMFVGRKLTSEGIIKGDIGEDELNYQACALPEELAEGMQDDLQINQIFLRSNDGVFMPLEKKSNIDRVKLYLDLGRRIIEGDEVLSHLAVLTTTKKVRHVPHPVREETSSPDLV